MTRWSWRQALAVVLGAWLALLVGGSVVISAGGWDPDHLPITAQFSAVIPFWLVAAAGTVSMARRFAAHPLEALGLRFRWVDLPSGIVAGVGLQLVVIPVLYGAFGVGHDELERSARELADSAQGTVGVVLFVLMACVIAPVVEELLYRGLLQRSGDWPDPIVGVVLTAVVFALSHLQLLELAGLTMFGLTAGLLVWRTDRLAPSIVAHVAFNASTVIPLLARR